MLVNSKVLEEAAAEVAVVGEKFVPPAGVYATAIQFETAAWLLQIAEPSVIRKVSGDLSMLSGPVGQPQERPGFIVRSENDNELVLQVGVLPSRTYRIHRAGWVTVA